MYNTQTHSTHLFPHSLFQRPPVLTHLPPSQGEGLVPGTLYLFQEPKAQLRRSAFEFLLPPASEELFGAGGVFPSSGTSHASKEPWFYVLENKIWVFECCMCPLLLGCHCFWVISVARARRYMFVY